MGFCEVIFGDLGRSSVFILCAGGVVCSYYALRSCEFFSYKSNDPTILPGPFYNVPEGYVGLFYHYDYEGGDGADLTTCDQFYDNFFVLQSDEWNLLFKIGQIAAVVGPAGAATAFLLNIMEWCCWQLTWTFFITFFMLFCGFVGQGLTFMIYGQTEFCFDDEATEECSLEIGAILSIAAAGAFYLASVIWCCMPRSTPLLKRGKSDKDTAGSRSVIEEQAPASRSGPSAKSARGSNNTDTESRGRSWQQTDEKPSYRQSSAAASHGNYEENDDSGYGREAMGGSAISDPTSSIQESSSQQQQQEQVQDAAVVPYYSSQQQPSASASYGQQLPPNYQSSYQSPHQPPAGADGDEWDNPFVEE